MHDDLGENCQHHWEPAGQLIFLLIDKDIIIKNCQQIKDKIVSEMSDLTKKLPAEKLMEESWTADKNKRRAKIASRNATNMNEKSIFRQMGWSNTFTDQSGDIIRLVKALSLDDKRKTKNKGRT